MRGSICMPLVGTPKAVHGERNVEARGHLSDVSVAIVTALQAHVVAAGVGVMAIGGSAFCRGRRIRFHYPISC